MKKLGFLAIILAMAISTAAHAEFKAGVAVRVVTPEKLLPISGGTGPSEMPTEQKGDLTVRALVLEDGDTRIAIVGSDFLGFPHALGDRVRAQVKDIPAENILIGVTHVHSAPDMYGFPDGKGGTEADLEYIESVCNGMAEAINEASANTQPASVKINTGEAADGIAWNAYAPRLYDPRCHVIQVLDADGKPVSTLVNFAIHPEVLSTRSKILSPDLCGPFYERIEANGGGTAIFMNSAQGAMVTADNRIDGGSDERYAWDECERIGNLLADEALRIIADALVQEDPDLYCASTRITFPIETGILDLVKGSPVMESMLEPGDNVSCQFNVVNLANAQIITIPGEALPNIGSYFKRKMFGDHNMVFGLTNDAFGYILVKEDYVAFDVYNYVSRTSLGERTGEILVDEGMKFIESCERPARLEAAAAR
jgi:hypothetical protein